MLFRSLQQNRLLIGNKYLLFKENGKDVIGILESATISEHEKMAWGAYRLEDGTTTVCSNPITDEELQAYKRHPDTFFGVPRRQGQKTDNPLELFDFFYKTYKKTSKEKLLELMKDRPDVEELRKLDCEELLVTCCEGWVYSAMRDSKKQSNNNPNQS